MYLSQGRLKAYKSKNYIIYQKTKINVLKHTGITYTAGGDR